MYFIDQAIKNECKAFIREITYFSNGGSERRTSPRKSHAKIEDNRGFEKPTTYIQHTSQGKERKIFTY